MLDMFARAILRQPDLLGLQQAGQQCRLDGASDEKRKRQD